MASLRQKIAQMLIMGFPGASITPNDVVYRWIKEEGIGGVIVFDKTLDGAAKNLRSMDQIQQLTGTLKAIAAEGDTALLLAIDYEGGAVDRLRDIPGCPPTLRPVDLAALSNEKQTNVITSMAKTLCTLGLNLNFAPLVDLAFDVESNIIASRGRSFSRDPLEVVALAALFTSIFNEHGLICCYKHFPGHGSAKGDTHLGCVDVTETFTEDELTPYRLLFQRPHAGVMVMTAHVVNRHLDPSGKPATLSAPILTQLLRQELRFEGVVVSDDLQMRAIAAQYSLAQTLAETINAGADMLIFGNQWGQHDASQVIDKIEHLVREQVIAEAQIHASHERIVYLKSML